jgi:hypothetical protein
MALHRGPKIITDGLVLCLDAADRKSYPGSGTVWYDRSGNSNHFTIQGNITWNSSTGFSNFEGNSTGSGNKIFRNNFPTNLKTSQGGQGYTVIVVARSTGTGGWKKLIGNSDGENYIDLYQNVASPYNYTTESGDTLFVDGVGVSSNSYTMYNAGFHFYIGTSLNAGGLINPTYALTIGNEPNNSPTGTNAYPWLGNIAIVLLYRRVLTTSEVLQNFTAQRGRFGI